MSPSHYIKKNNFPLSIFCYFFLELLLVGLLDLLDCLFLLVLLKCFPISLTIFPSFVCLLFLSTWKSFLLKNVFLTIVFFFHFQMFFFYSLFQDILSLYLYFKRKTTWIRKKKILNFSGWISNDSVKLSSKVLFCSLNPFLFFFFSLHFRVTCSIFFACFRLWFFSCANSHSLNSRVSE